jgi:hypothetical protein
MKLEQRKYYMESGWDMEMNTELSKKAQLVLVFYPTSLLKTTTGIVKMLKSYYPQAHIAGCSGHGEISGVQVDDVSMVVTAVEFENTPIKGACISPAQAANSFQVGEMLAGSIPASIPCIDPGAEDKLVLALIFTDGLNINGSELVKGLSSRLPESVTITGGLSGDSINFNQTSIIWDKEPIQNKIAILGFYGEHLKIGCGSMGGWDPFGPERLVTRSEGNVLYEFDGQSALALYKKYLGKYADDLPASGHFFPLSFRDRNAAHGVIRSLVSINEEDQSMTFAGDIPEDSYSRLMKTNIERLIDGATEAAKASLKSMAPTTPQLAFLVSCAGRRLVLRQRFEEELEAVQEVLGKDIPMTGFYSYGEISPFAPGVKCELHNQTMTVTTIAED